MYNDFKIEIGSKLITSKEDLRAELSRTKFRFNTRANIYINTHNLGVYQLPFCCGIYEIGNLYKDIPPQLICDILEVCEYRVMVTLVSGVHTDLINRLDSENLIKLPPYKNPNTENYLKTYINK